MATFQVISGQSSPKLKFIRKLEGMCEALQQEIKGNKAEKDVAGVQEMYVGEQNRNVGCCISLFTEVARKHMGSLMCYMARPGFSVAIGVGSFDVTLNIGSR